MQLGFDDFTSLMSALPEIGQRFCVAVSGGADSLALTLLCADWAKKTGRQLVALSVNHGLRPESQDECAQVHTLLQARSIEHHTLVWQGTKPKNGIQAAARKARYDLLTDWCAEHEVQDLFLAHHQDDQAETFLLRLARGSGVDGLGAMKAVSQKGALRLIRPLLTVPKTALVAFLQGQKVDWIEDPSNQNGSFDRVKIRNQMEMLADIGLTPYRLAQTAQAMQRAADSLQGITRDWLYENACFFDEGYVLLSPSALYETDDEIALRALSRIGQALSGQVYPPRFERLCRLLEKLRLKESATFMGCRWIVREADILICREVRESVVPEGLYEIRILHSSSNVYSRVLGQDGWQQICDGDSKSPDSDLAHEVVVSLISFWDEEGVLAVPHLGYKRTGAQFEVHLSSNGKNRLFS